MSRPAGGRFHLWFWVIVGVLLYVASCPPVEAWHDKQAGVFTLAAASPTLRGPTFGNARRYSSEDEFEITGLHFIPPPSRPKWMQLLYAPVHFIEQYPPFAVILRQYRDWCEELFSGGS